MSPLGACTIFENMCHIEIYGSYKNEQSQWAFTCSKLTIETLEQGVKYVQN